MDIASCSSVVVRLHALEPGIHGVRFHVTISRLIVSSPVCLGGTNIRGTFSLSSPVCVWNCRAQIGSHNSTFGQLRYIPKARSWWTCKTTTSQIRGSTTVRPCSDFPTLHCRFLNFLTLIKNAQTSGRFNGGSQHFGGNPPLSHGLPCPKKFYVHPRGVAGMCHCGPRPDFARTHRCRDSAPKLPPSRNKIQVIPSRHPPLDEEFLRTIGPNVGGPARLSPMTRRQHRCPSPRYIRRPVYTSTQSHDVASLGPRCRVPVRF